MSFLLATVAFAAVLFALQYVGRVYHRPDHPVWLDGDFVASAVCVGFTGAIAITLALLLKAATTLPLPLWGDAAAVLAAIVVAYLAVRYAFRAAVGGSVPAQG